MDESPRGRIPEPPPCYCSRPWRFQAEVGEEMTVRGGGSEGSPERLSVEAAHGPSSRSRVPAPAVRALQR